DPWFTGRSNGGRLAKVPFVSHLGRQPEGLAGHSAGLSARKGPYTCHIPIAVPSRHNIGTAWCSSSIPRQSADALSVSSRIEQHRVGQQWVAESGGRR